MINLRVLMLCLYFMMLFVPIAAQAETVFYVSPEGNDQWTGRLAQPNADRTDGPLASLEGARVVIRQLKANGTFTEPVRVQVATGSYPMNQPVVFTPEDSGTAACPIRYEAAPNTHPLFTGGREITGFQPADNGIWTAQIPEVADGSWYFEQLWIDGKRATRARSPNRFYYYATEKLEVGMNPETGKQEEGLFSRALHSRHQDIEPLLQVPKDRFNDVTVVAYHSWETSRSRLALVDAAENNLFMTAPIPWGFNYWGSNQRYHIENFRQALDEPGEWFLDRDGTLSYLPLPGQDMAKAQVVAPVTTEDFIHISGDAAAGKLVENITFQGLSFAYGQYILPPTGHGDSQAEYGIPAAIMLDGARNVAFEDCAVQHVGIYGMWFRHGCQNCSVTHTIFDDLGAGGVRVGEGNSPPPAEQTHHITVDNCIIHSGARLHHGAIGIWVGNSSDNQITHNDISDLYYTGISVGWSWGYNPTLSQRNHIDFNHIHHIGWGVLSDMGGVYTLGLAEGTTVNNNCIHDVHSYDLYGRGGWGLYNDEGTTHITMENNLVYNTKTGNYHQHYGRENTIRNNIFAYSMDGQIQRSRVEEHLSFTFTNNIVLWKQGPLYSAGSFKDNNVVAESNLYWDETGELTYHGETLEAWQAKNREKGSLVADPLFVDPAHGNFHLKSNSPAVKIGFKPFDYTKAGLYGDPKWVSIPKKFKFPPVEFAPAPPPPPPFHVDDDFELSAVGDKPRNAQVNTENKGDAIALTDETAAAGKNSLKILDAPDLQFPFNPHLVYLPNHNKGTSLCSFDMRIEPGVNMYHEWRGWDVQPYRIGPTFWIQDGKLNVHGQNLLELPESTWFHIEIRAKVGTDADGTWTLIVTLPGQPPRPFAGLKTGHPDFGNFTWVGWSSMATDARVFYLDNIKLENDTPLPD